MNMFIKICTEVASSLKSRQTDPRTGKRRRRLLASLVLLALAAALCLGYLLTYYPAEPEALAPFPGAPSIQERRMENGDLVFGTGNEAWGLIFYPGAKVDYRAYAPLMRELAAEGVFCVICRMPFHLAVLDPKAADGLREAWPEVGSWYLGGHSLGGVMAARYLADRDGYRGLILLASYADVDLSDRDLRVLSIYGSQDRVLDLEDYRENRSNLPPNTLELVLDGGCHAGFGLYGPQRGDGTATISGAEQIHRTAEAVMTLLRGEKGANLHAEAD